MARPCRRGRAGRGDFGEQLDNRTGGTPMCDQCRTILAQWLRDHAETVEQSDGDLHAELFLACPIDGATKFVVGSVIGELP